MAAAGEDQFATLPQITDMESYRKLAKNPLVRMVDMTADMREEAVDIIGMAVEKHMADLEKCAQVAGAIANSATRSVSSAVLWRRFALLSLGLVWSQQIKEMMDAKFGGPFHCVCGQTFGFRVTHEVRTQCLLCLCLLWLCLAMRSCLPSLCLAMRLQLSKRTATCGQLMMCR